MSEDGSKIEATDKKPAEPPKKKKRWLKVLFILFGLFCLLIAGIYFYISSAAFIRGQVFTKVEQHLNQPISSEEISFSPLSGLELKKFTLGDDPFLKADTIRLHYDLISIINGKIKVSEITLENAELNVIINRDGKLNILSKVVEKIEAGKEVPKAETEKPGDINKATAQKKKNGTPPEVKIENINFKNLKLHVFRDSSDEEKLLDLNLENFSFSLPEIANGKDLAFELETAVNCKAGETFNLKNGLIKVSGKSKLSADLVPELIGLDIKISSLDAVNKSINLPLKALNILADIGIDGKK